MILTPVHAEILEEILDTQNTDSMSQAASEAGIDTDVSELILSLASGETTPSLDFLKSKFHILKDHLSRQGISLFFRFFIPMLAASVCSALAKNSAIRLISTVICLSVFLEAFAGTVTAADMLLQKIVVLTDAVFPVVTGFLSLAGDISGTAFLSPMAGFVSTATAGIMKKWGVFICCAAAACASGCGFAGSLRLDGLFSLLRTAAVWLTGGIMTMFIAILSIQGLLGRSYDSAAMRTAQYAVDHALPVIGGGISDSLGTILSSISMIKAASGATGMLIIITACMEPIAEIWLTGFALKLAAAAASPIGYTDIISTAERFSQAATMLLTICIASAAMALMLLGAAISAGRGML